MYPLHTQEDGIKAWRVITDSKQNAQKKKRNTIKYGCDADGWDGDALEHRVVDGMVQHRAFSSSVRQPRLIRAGRHIALRYIEGGQACNTRPCPSIPLPL